MNVFCYPGVTCRKAVCSLLGIEPGLRPRFGVKPGIPLISGRADRTEIDMGLGHLLVEAKLDNKEPIRFAPVGGELCQKLVWRYTRRSRQTQFLANLLPDRPRHQRGCRQAGLVLGRVQSRCTP